jgi:CspA family cold shock protein
VILSVSSRKEFNVADGIVKWFDPEKGYGFITSKDGADIFVHYTAIPGEGYRTLTPGEKVQFDLIISNKGPQAKNVLSYS